MEVVKEVVVEREVVKEIIVEVPIVVTATPGATATPEPTATRTASPTTTPVPPTRTLEPSATPVPLSNTPVPTLTPVPVRTEPGNGYYTQFAEARGVSVKANDKVDPAALQEAARIIALMLDGREDIAECIGEWESSFAIAPNDVPFTTLPEFAHLKGHRDIWDAPYDEVLIPGLGA